MGLMSTKGGMKKVMSMDQGNFKSQGFAGMQKSPSTMPTPTERKSIARLKIATTEEDDNIPAKIVLDSPEVPKEVKNSTVEYTP